MITYFPESNLLQIARKMPIIWMNESNYSDTTDHTTGLCAVRSAVVQMWYKDI